MTCGQQQRSRMSVPVVLAAFALALALAATGCSTGSQTPAASTPRSSTASAPAVVRLVEGFPADVPIYPQAAVVTSLKNLSEGEQYVANLRSMDSPQVVHDWYAERIPAAGWEVMSEVAVEQGAGNIVAETVERQLVVSVAPAAGGGTDLFLTVSRVVH